MTTCPHCGCDLIKARRALRSHPQLARFMVLMQAAFEHWPERHPFRPRTWEHLRYWFAVQAGHCEIKKTIICRRVPASVLKALLIAIVNSIDDERTFVDDDGGQTVVIRKAKSIGYMALKHMQACELFRTVDEMLAAMGLPPEQLLPKRDGTSACVMPANARSAAVSPA